MPELTTNLGLEKPLGNETADIAVINSNMDKVDGEITKKASTTEDGRMSKEDKTKLDGVEDNANNYQHPAAHPAEMITEDAAHRFTTDTEKANWNGKLDASAKAVDSDKLDGIDSSQFVRNDRNNTINGNLAVNGYLQAKGFVSDTTDTVRVMFPSGGAYKTGTPSVTGAIKITLPVSWTSTMLRFTVKVFEYASGESFDVTVGGYNYITGSGWVNTSAYIIGDAGINRDFTVRFGHDGSKCCVYIGETSSTWSYPQVTVTDFEGGPGGSINNETWNDGWDVSVASSFGTISSTITGTQVGRTVDGNIIWHAGNDGSGSGLDADKLDGVDSSQFVRNDRNSNITGNVNVNGNISIDNKFRLDYNAGEDSLDFIYIG